ncbi:MAG TPA: hypothetical protein VMT71_05155 [Syntrophorhabdales bacterium]|nr:hypothetical protein [Syntrophorhabdales bacterium]
MSEETIQVQVCPHCKGHHRYRLQVERAKTLITARKGKKGEQPSVIRITSRLMCPLHEKNYQVSFDLQDTSADRIRAVSVLGPARED